MGLPRGKSSSCIGGCKEGAITSSVSNALTDIKVRAQESFSIREVEFIAFFESEYLNLDFPIQN